MVKPHRLSLAEARRLGKLDEFVAQREAEGVGPVDSKALNDALNRVITSHEGSRPASRSPGRGGSRGK